MIIVVIWPYKKILNTEKILKRQSSQSKFSSFCFSQGFSSNANLHRVFEINLNQQISAECKILHHLPIWHPWWRKWGCYFQLDPNYHPPCKISLQTLEGHELCQLSPILQLEDSNEKNEASTRVLCIQEA